MARTPSVKIVSWGTPPEPEPTGWDAIAQALDAKPGQWANLGEFSVVTGRKVQNDCLPASAGYEHRIIPSKTDERRVTVWARRVESKAATTK